MSLRRFRRSLPLVASVGLSLSACADSGPPAVLDDVPRDELRPMLERQNTRWLGRRDASYVVVTCGRGFDVPACVRAAVVNGEVQAAQRTSFDRTGYAEATASEVQEPLAALLDEARRRLGSAPASCTFRAAFDPEREFLASYWESCWGEGGGRKVECFVPDTTDLDACPIK